LRDDVKRIKQVRFVVVLVAVASLMCQRNFRPRSLGTRLPVSQSITKTSPCYQPQPHYAPTSSRMRSTTSGGCRAPKLMRCRRRWRRRRPCCARRAGG
jgi:hypothetical protein